MFSKNAANYGFLPGNGADENARALQRLVDEGGTVCVDQPGVYDISRTILLSDDTALIFGAGVYVRRAVCGDGVQRLSYAFANRGAFSRAWNRNISITGLRLIADGQEPKDSWENGGEHVIGLNAHLAFFYIQNLIIRDFEMLDLPKRGFCIQICTFQNALLENLHIEGMKDAVHFGKGSKFVVRHGIFRTFDDPIALNANDYATSNPQMGWIEDGLIEDCYDLDQPETTGFFCRILAGSWGEWREGMTVQHSDSALSEGRLYRVVMQPDGKEYVSRTRPTHTNGTRTYDGITWAMVQDDDLCENCGCRNIHFKDIVLEKRRPVAFSIHFDNDNWSRSYYPGTRAPVQENITFENVTMKGDIPVLVLAKTPVDAIRVVNSSLGDCTVELKGLPKDSPEYGVTHVLFSGCTFRGAGERPLILCREGRSATLRALGNITQREDFRPEVRGSVRVIAADFPIKK